MLNGVRERLPLSADHQHAASHRSGVWKKLQDWIGTAPAGLPTMRPILGAEAAAKYKNVIHFFVSGCFYARSGRPAILQVVDRWQLREAGP